MSFGICTFQQYLGACPPQDPLSTLERDLALQLQIAEAARCLSREENLAKQVRKRRKSAVLKEEKKLKELEQALSEYRLVARRHSSPLTASAPALEGEQSVSRYGFPNWSSAWIERLSKTLGGGLEMQNLKRMVWKTGPVLSKGRRPEDREMWGK